jgi:hypothetical protein
VFLSAPAGTPAWTAATQELYAARVNVSTTAPLIGDASVLALMVNETNVASGLNPSLITGARVVYPTFPQLVEFPFPGPANSGVNTFLLTFVPTATGQLTLSINAPPE